MGVNDKKPSYGFNPPLIQGPFTRVKKPPLLLTFNSLEKKWETPENSGCPTLLLAKDGVGINLVIKNPGFLN